MTGPADADLSLRFIGLWRLAASRQHGAPHPDRGSGSTGFIVYDASGQMMVQVIPGHDRGTFADPNDPTPEEARKAFRGVIAYFGTWQVDGTAGTITHHRTGSINPTTAVPVVRRFTFEGPDRVVFNPVEHPANSIVWERVR